MRKTRITCHLYTDIDAATKEYVKNSVLNEYSYLYSVLWRCEEVALDAYESFSKDSVLGVYYLGKKLCPDWWVREFLVNTVPSYPEKDLCVYFYSPEFSPEELKSLELNNIRIINN